MGRSWTWQCDRRTATIPLVVKRRSTSEPDSVTPPTGLRVTRGALGDRDVVIFSWPLAEPPPKGPFADAPLTAAERAVIHLVLAGRAIDDIAALRGTGASTVKKQIAAAYRKLEVGSRGELAARARRERSA